MKAKVHASYSDLLFLIGDQALQEISNRCRTSSRAPVNGTSSTDGACQRTYLEIRETLMGVDLQIQNACDYVAEARKHESDCTKEGQQECLDWAAIMYSRAASSLRVIPDLFKDAAAKLKQQRAVHVKVAISYQNHLNQIAYLAKTCQQTKDCDVKPLLEMIDHSVNTNGLEGSDSSSVLKLSGIRRDSPDLVAQDAAEKVSNISGVVLTSSG